MEVNLKLSELVGLQNPLVLGLVIYVLQVLVYWLICSGVTGFYSAWAARGVGAPIDPGERRPFQTQQERKWGLSTCAVISVYLFAATLFVQMLFPVSALAAAVNTIGFLIAYDLWMYATHRLLHTRLLARFHVRHHNAIRATPWSSLNMHPIEAVINYLPFLLFAVVSEVSLAVLLGVHVYLLVGIANSHANYSLLSKHRKSGMLRELVTFHQGHHSNPTSNYGFLFTHWDWLFGTRVKV